MWVWTSVNVVFLGSTCTGTGTYSTHTNVNLVAQRRQLPTWKKASALAKTCLHSDSNSLLSRSPSYFPSESKSDSNCVALNVCKTAAIDACLQAVQFYEANYPEILRRVFVVNAPKIFSIAIALVKPFLNETTTNKIRILPGNDPSHWREAILQEIDADQFPACYGGSQTDPDGNPLCISKVNMGGPVPHSYYFNRNLKVDNSSSYKNMTVSYRAKEKLELQVDDPGSSLRWQFYSEEGDIGFGIFKRDGGAKSVVVPKDRVDCHMAPEEGEIDTEPGRYVVEFDNSYSYLRSKNIWYSITVDRPSKSRT